MANKTYTVMKDGEELKELKTLAAAKKLADAEDAEVFCEGLCVYQGTAKDSEDTVSELSDAVAQSPAKEPVTPVKSKMVALPAGGFTAIEPALEKLILEALKATSPSTVVPSGRLSDISAWEPNRSLISDAGTTGNSNEDTSEGKRYSPVNSATFSMTRPTHPSLKEMVAAPPMAMVLTVLLLK